MVPSYISVPLRAGRTPRPTKPRAVPDEAPLPKSALQTAARHIAGKGCVKSSGEGIRARSGEGGGALRVDTPRCTRCLPCVVVRGASSVNNPG